MVQSNARSNTLFQCAVMRNKEIISISENSSYRNPIFDWDALRDRRSLVLERHPSMPPYLLKPEVIELLGIEKHSSRRLIVDLLWCTGGTISEILGIKPKSFVNNGSILGVNLKRLNENKGRPTKAQQEKISPRFVPFNDSLLIDRIKTYLADGNFRPDDRIFDISRQTVNRHIHALVDKSGGAPFSIHAETFRHSFAVNLVLHGLPYSNVRDVLGLKSIEQVDIYSKTLLLADNNLLDGVYFH